MKTTFTFFLCLATLTVFSWAHVYGPSYTCPNSILTYNYDTNYGGGSVTLSTTNGLIFNQVTNNWVSSWTFDVGDLSLQGLPIWNQIFDVKWNNVAIGSSGNVHIYATDFIFFSNGNRGVTFGPSPGTPTIVGNNYILNCNSEQQSYTATNLPEGWQLTGWNFSSHIQQVNGTLTPKTIQATSTTWQGMETLTGIFNFTTGGNTCSTQNVNKNIWLGAPSASSQTVDGSNYSPGYQLCPGSHWVGISWNGLVNSTNWHVYSGSTYYTTNTQCNFNLEVNGPSSFTITVSGNGGCGTSSTTTWFLAKKSFGCGTYMVAAYPNPTSDEVTIQSTFIDDTETEKLVIPDEILLIDNSNEKVIRNTPNESITLLNIKNLRKGEYFLKVRFGKEIITNRIIIDR